jgi:NRPS condensation-like uncharacterized protein
MPSPLKIPNRFDSVRSDNGVACGSAVCDLQIHAVVSFDGQLDLLRLKKAMRLSLDAEPVLGCRFVTGKWHQFWQRREDLDHLELCTLIETRQTETNLIAYLAAPLDLRADPLIQARIFRSTTDTLCIKANHIVTDAAGVKEYLLLLSSIYRSLKNDAQYRPQINLQGRRTHRPITERLSIADKLRILRQSLRLWISDLRPPSNWSFPSQGRDLAHPTFLIRHLSQECFSKIKQYSRQHCYSLNDIVTAAFYHAFYQIILPNPGTPLRLGMTVDLSRYLPEGRREAITNLAALFLLHLGPKLGETLAETIAIVHRQIKRSKENYMGLELTKTVIFGCRWLPIPWRRWLVGYIAKLNRRLGPQEVPPWLTNMGVMLAQDLRFGTVAVRDAFLTAPIGFPPFFVVGITGFEESLTFSIGFCPNSTNQHQVENLLDLVENLLCRGLST